MGATHYATSLKLTLRWPSVWGANCEDLLQSNKNSGATGCSAPGKFAEFGPKVALTRGSERYDFHPKIKDF